jgi:hypothetical protein
LKGKTENSRGEKEMWGLEEKFLFFLGFGFFLVERDKIL